MKKQKLGEVAIVDSFEALNPKEDFNGNRKDIEVTIGVECQDGPNGKLHPQNFSLDDLHGAAGVQGGFGGCFARVWASGSWNHFACYGPRISYGGLLDFEHGARALKALARRFKAQYHARGCSCDQAEEMGRWLEACGIDRVYIRPDEETSRGWHDRGDWHVLSVGEFVNKVRRALYVFPPEPVQVDRIPAPAISENLVEALS